MTTEPPYLLDVNVLIALANPSHVHHGGAQAWLAALPEGAHWATCPTTEAGFLRLMLNPDVTGQDLTAATVLDLLHRVHRSPGHTFVADDTTLAQPHISLGALMGPKQVTDFHLANLAAGRGLRLVTFDRRIASSLAATDRDVVVLLPA